MNTKLKYVIFSDGFYNKHASDVPPIGSKLKQVSVAYRWAVFNLNVTSYSTTHVSLYHGIIFQKTEIFSFLSHGDISVSKQLQQW
jgi:hypothetical protein